MDVVFASAEVGDACRVASSRERYWAGSAHTIGRRLSELAAVGTLADAAMLPGLAMSTQGNDGRWCLTCMHGVEFDIRAWPSVDSSETEPDPTQITGIMIDAVNIIDSKEVIPS